MVRLTRPEITATEFLNIIEQNISSIKWNLCTNDITGYVDDVFQIDLERSANYNGGEWFSIEIKKLKETEPYGVFKIYVIDDEQTEKKKIYIYINNWIQNKKAAEFTRYMNNYSRKKKLAKLKENNEE
jgi:hypothetical protein